MEDLRARHQDQDQSNDAVYLIDISPDSPEYGSAIDLDISSLGLGENLQVKDLPVIDGVEYTSSDDAILVSCVGSASGRSESEEEEVEDAGGAESEESEESEEDSEESESNSAE